MGQKRKSAAVSPPPVIADWSEADRVLGQVATNRACLARIAAEAETIIEKAKADAKEVSGTISTKLVADLKALEAFTRAHETELEGRSKTLTHGILGLRRTTAIMLKRKAEFVINALRATKGLMHCVRITESIDKDALRPCTDDVLASVGCRRQVRDVFYADTDEVKL